MHTAACSLLGTQGQPLWPSLAHLRRHLLDTPGGKGWDGHAPGTHRRTSAISGPIFIKHSNPTRDQGGSPKAVLSSKVGQAAKEYCAALAASSSMLRWNHEEDADAILISSSSSLCNQFSDVDLLKTRSYVLNRILAVGEEVTESQDTLAAEVSQDLWLQGTQAMKALTLHHLSKYIPDAMGHKLDGEQL